MNRLLILATTALLAGSADAEDNVVHDMMVVSKMTGACGIAQQMAEFQRTTQMPGGDEFVARFWKMEFARLGVTQKEYITNCERSFELYKNYWDAAEAASK
ncbi:hypothetical protein ACQCLI_15105 [Pseudomonas nitroreducens]|uniref:hypothetical protein n=1 Tax=Pseudomonas nitroreducens TaxID=46680 RepID=UPI000372716D|nr:hypothetical protein [Pseudomonas nitroreducens]